MSKNYIFGYGSIINSNSRFSTQTSQYSANEVLDVEISSDWGYIRSWCFRSRTGFTALGLRKCKASDNVGINGVLVPINDSDLSAYDIREEGYSRVVVPLEMIALLRFDSTGQLSSKELFDTQIPMLTVFTYIPNAISHPDHNHPILQTYIDTCLRGCIERGGKQLAVKFLRSTFDWNEFYLYDNPISRRPWEHRADWRELDACLEAAHDHIHLEHRQHPEDFSAMKMSSSAVGNAGMRMVEGGREGEAVSAPSKRQAPAASPSPPAMPVCESWNVPPRNCRFVGREHYLGKIEDMLCAHGGGDMSLVSQVALVGLGGVGKSDIAMEYCHRHIGVKYHLVIWVRAENLSSISADMRLVAAKFGLLSNSDLKAIDRCDENAGSSSRSNESGLDSYVADDSLVAELVKRKLASLEYAWLVVLDNLEDEKVVRAYMPSSAKAKRRLGHVLVTTRLDIPEWHYSGGVLNLQCFDSSESFQFLSKSLSLASADLASTQTQVLSKLSTKLGNLPLALTLAVAYIVRCDVTPVEYLLRLDSLVVSERSAAKETSVSASLSLSVSRIVVESASAASVLPCLAFLSPDDITKTIVSTLLLTSFYKCSGPTSRHSTPRTVGVRLSYFWNDKYLVSVIVLSFFLILISFWTARIDLLPLLLVPAVTYSLFLRDGTRESAARPKLVPPSEEELCAETDHVWDTLKQFSILTSKRVGANSLSISSVRSIHRLQQAVLRAKCNTDEYIIRLEQCIWALSEMWSFDPHNSSSWRQSEEVLEHVQCMLVHLGEGGGEGGEGSGKGERKKQAKAEVKIRASIRRKLAVLLTNVGSYLAHALSRFEAAQKLLEAAVGQLRGLMSTCTTSDCFDDDGFFLVSEDFSSALHVLGRVLRYGGKLDLAESVLTEALRLRQSAASACTESREPSSHIADIADTLHELGVLYLRIGKHKLAQQNLEESLRLRRFSRIENNKKTLRTTEAATLHLLAVVATAGKHYDVAEKYLMEAVGLSHRAGGGGKDLASQAASLQQLGRISLRKGLIETAQKQLQQALDIYSKVYGSTASHVNIAAVWHQLGETSLAAKNFELACEQFLNALSAREKVSFGQQNIDHIELALEMRSITQALLLDKKYEKAMHYCELATSMMCRIITGEIRSILRANNHYNDDSVKDAKSIAEMLDSLQLLRDTDIALLLPSNQLKRSIAAFADILHIQKSIMRNLKSPILADIVKLLALLKRISATFNTHSDNEGSSSQSKSQFKSLECSQSRVQALLSSRSELRSLARGRASRVVLPAANLPSPESGCDSIRSIALNLQSAWAACGEPISSEEALAGCRSDVEECVQYLLSVREEGVDSKKLFEICDRLRIALKQCGVVVSD